MQKTIQILLLFAAGTCAVSSMPAAAQTESAGPKHYRLTFVVDYPQGQKAAQTFVLDVPVAPEKAGMAGTTMASGLIGETEGSMQENLLCTDVQKSTTGLAAKVAFSMDSVTKPVPGSTEPLHHNLTFNRQIDVALGRPTRITEEMHITPLRKGDAVLTNAPEAPRITITAVEM